MTQPSECGLETIVEDLESVLLAMERLLRSMHEYGRADLLRRKRADRQAEPREVLDWLASAAVWGSSGTLADRGLRLLAIRGCPSRACLAAIQPYRSQLPASTNCRVT